MRKTHWACLFVGLLAGFALGFGLVVVQLKYGRSPVVSGDLTAEAEQPSSVTEPTTIDDESGDSPGELTPEPVVEPPVAKEGSAIQVPIGPVEVTAVQRPRTGGPEDKPSGPDGIPQNLEQVEQRMLTHLIQYAQAGGQVAAAAEPTAELLPMPKEESAQEPTKQEVTTVPPPEPPTVSTFKPQTPVGDGAAAPTVEGAKPEAAKRKKQPLPYCGKYGAVIDSHYRMTLPAEIHEMMASPRPRVLYVLPGEEQCIDVYTETGIRTVLDTLAHSEENDDAERERRILLSKISRVEVRADGEFKLPAELVREAIVDTNPVVIIGVSDHFEIWDAQRWQQYNQPADAEPASFDDLTHILGTVIKHVLGDVPLPFEVNTQIDDPNRRMRELLNQTDGMRPLEEDRERIWFTDQPSHLNPQRIHGGIQ
ncbi:hypothetical protein AYO44_11520 [Planctomycetaceae bacterium SCGC AG-212-F19]|nr:hypothetical protein AYO44_11520 [Planctomycetaceae bacterium SCGC AG-212-F19]